MPIEHVALNVPDPVALADWYARHLGMTVVRAVSGPPFTRFLADDAGRTVLEVYGHTAAPVPDYPAQHPLVLHVAFTSNDVAADRERLVAAGAAPDGEISRTPGGDEMTFVRDPWGVVIQLVRRAAPLM
jgi:glyoxylase I family protein